MKVQDQHLETASDVQAGGVTAPQEHLLKGQENELYDILHLKQEILEFKKVKLKKNLKKKATQIFFLPSSSCIHLCSVMRLRRSMSSNIKV